MDYGEENLNDLFLLLYKISDHTQRPIKILFFFVVVVVVVFFFHRFTCPPKRQTRWRQVSIFNSSFKSMYLSNT